MSDNLPAKTEAKHGKIACILISIVAIGLHFVPIGYYILYPFSLIYTFVHEMGHGIMAELVGGNFVKFEMWTDGSGVATSQMLVDASRLDHALVSFGGLIAPALWAAIFMLVSKSKRAAAYGMYVVSFLCLLSLIFYVRNLFGIVFVILCMAISYAIGHFSIKRVEGKVSEIKSYAQYGMLFLAMTLCTCVFSRGDYLFTAVAETSEGNMPSDVAQIANNLFLPYWFWGGLIALISVAVLFIGIWAFFKTPQNKQIEDNS